MSVELPEEIIENILSYAPDFHDNLKHCHEELKNYRLRPDHLCRSNESMDITYKKILYWNAIGFIAGTIIISVFKMIPSII